ncbi:hypothetical protein [Xanthomarina sp.]|nr:hypothetical protein [Xanthomarina sp.]
MQGERRTGETETQLGNSSVFKDFNPETSELKRFLEIAAIS